MFSIYIPILCHLNSKSFIEWALLSLPPFAASTLIMHSFWTFGSLELRRHISWMFVFRILRVLLRACLFFSVDVHYYLLGSKQLKFTKWWLFCMPAAIKLGCLWQQMHAIASCSHTNGKNIHMMITRYSYIGIRGSEAAPFDEGSKLTSFLKHREFLMPSSLGCTKWIGKKIVWIQWNRRFCTQNIIYPLPSTLIRLPCRSECSLRISEKQILWHFYSDNRIWLVHFDELRERRWHD